MGVAARRVRAGQSAFGFLEAVPRRERRAQRAFRPHLRTHAPGEQIRLPLRSPPGAPRYVGIEACEVEAALRAARVGDAGAVGQLLALTRPEVHEVARAIGGPRCPLSVEELAAVGEARLVELRAWERFTPGRERGRTLWPAYARRVARQAMATALDAEGPVHVTRWARRRRAALEERAEAEGRTLEEVLAESPEGGAAAALLAAPRAVPEEVLLRTEEDTGERAELAQQALAVVHLARLPVRERVAVAGPLGFLAEGKLSDARLARHLRCSVAEVVELRERGLERLREAMEA